MATSGGLPPSIWVPRNAAISSPAERKPASIPVSSWNASSTARKFSCSAPTWTEATSIGSPPSASPSGCAAPSSSPAHAVPTSSMAIITTNNFLVQDMERLLSSILPSLVPTCSVDAQARLGIEEMQLRRVDEELDVVTLSRLALRIQLGDELVLTRLRLLREL